ncbi:phosphate ABC transporter ATP-binding protein [candidate division WOR-3 bacterium]|jgi:phosphate transport system ATP-binding protein|nr:phosphate ABC transporter ATP-binding protein [candidate division WOR-3 bacterium]
MVDYIIKVKNLNLWFDSKKILENITVSIPKNKLTAIIGPSGCGKSTFLKTLNRMNDLVGEMKLNGGVYIDNKDIYENGIDVYSLRMKVGMVFQKPNPFPKSIFDNIAFGLHIKGIKDKYKIAEIVERSLRDAWLWEEVKDRLHSSAFSLSGGQQQRLCIARALATQPEVLLLDEPTSALDPKSTNKIEELLVELKNLVTIILVTHNLSQSARVSDYTMFLYLGELIEFGETDKIFTTPKNQKTEKYLTGKFG